MPPTLPCPLCSAALRLLQACVATGTTDTATLAKHLFLSPHTIRSTFYRIHLCLDVHDRYAALKMATDNGWISG
jgi:DNA-binding CsgD family transcriptional regulator